MPTDPGVVFLCGFSPAVLVASMGRYGRELGAAREDPAGKYLDDARRRRKEHLAGKKSAPKDTEATGDLSAWPRADMLGGFSTEAVKEILNDTKTRVVFHGLDKEQRALVHQMAHQLGFINSSKTDPVYGRVVYVSRPLMEVVPDSPDRPGDGSSTKRNRWRREKKEEAALPTPQVPAPLPAEPLPMAMGREALPASGAIRSLCIVWLRDDMRLQDNPALSFATKFDAVVPVFILESEQQVTGAARFWKYESLRIFSQTLASLGSALLLRTAVGSTPAAELAKISSECNAPQKATWVAFNRRCEAWQQRVDQETTEKLQREGLKVKSFPGNVLYEPQELQPIERWQIWRKKVRTEEAEWNGQKAKNKSEDSEHISGFGSYRFFSHALEQLGAPPAPVPGVTQLPPVPPSLSPSVDLSFLGRTAGRGFSSAKGVGSCSDWAAGIKAWWKVGEEAALQRLEHFLQKVLSSGDFEGRKRLLSDEKNTSELSPYIRFGEISVKFIYAAAKQHAQRTDQRIFADSGYAYDQERPKANATFLRRFVWRDLAYWFLWEFPSLPVTSLRPQYEEQIWSGTAAQLKRWQRGSTGFPLVDAAMQQLWQVGWIPNYLRHVVAQMLIEYLDISWKRGLEWFEWTLVDADVAINSFMWQNGGHSGPDQWEFVLHPVNAAKSCDPDGSYVRRWLPFLSQCPTEYIHRPWELPMGRRHGLTPPILLDLDAARKQHCRHVLQLRKRHPEMIARNGHEWLRLPGRKGLLAKVVTRQEFRADTEDFIFYQSRPGRFGRKAAPAAASSGRGGRLPDANQAILAEEVLRQGELL